MSLTLREEIALVFEAGFGDRWSHTTTGEEQTEVYVKGHRAPIVIYADVNIGIPGWVGEDLTQILADDARAILAKDAIEALSTQWRYHHE